MSTLAGGLSLQAFESTWVYRRTKGTADPSLGSETHVFGNGGVWPAFCNALFTASHQETE